jgi:hypothetical protein
MQDMNDYYVNDNCQTRVHIGGYVFTIAELYTNTLLYLSPEELEKHEEGRFKNAGT